MTQRTPVTFEMARQIALALPGVEEGTSYGAPAFRVRGKFLARLREDGATLVVKCDYRCKNLLLSSIYPPSSAAQPQEDWLRV